MEKIRRKIRLFFVSYGRLFFYIIGGFLILIMFIQTLNNLAIEQNAKNNETISENIIVKEEIVLTEEQKKEEENKILYISKFIDNCNTGKIKEAYEMLSNKCKEEYKSIEEFEQDYIKEVFDIYICDYEILRKNDIYEATLTQDMLITGKTNSNKIEKYKLDWVLEQKIYIVSNKK